MVQRDDAASDYGPGSDDGSTGFDDAHDPRTVRLRAAMAAAKYHGVELDPTSFRAEPNEPSPSPATLVRWMDDQGLVAKAMRLKWRYLVRLHNTPPIVLMFKDGSAGLFVASDQQRGIVWLRDPMGSESDPMVAVDELRLSQVWTGDVMLLRRARNGNETERPVNMRWLAGVVMREKRIVRDIMLASMVLAVLTILPALIIMQVINKVIAEHSVATLFSVTMIMIGFTFYETLLTYARRELVLVMAARLDSRISLHIFNRLLALPLEYFERQQTGQVIGRVMQIYKVRDFMTGSLLRTFLDMFTLIIVLPFLFFLSPTLAWMTLAAAGAIGLIVVIFMGPMAYYIGRVTGAEMERGSILYESIAGIRTLKTLALEPARKQEWDVRTAEVTRWKLAAGRMANWPQTLIMPLEMFISRGIMLIGAYLALSDAKGSAVGAGGLVAFMMLGGRVAAPLVGLARLLEEFTEVRASLAEAGAVLNNPTETRALTNGMRPKILGALSFIDVNFTYPGAPNKALDGVDFEIPAGTMLGVVGRSGSGKSTLTRLLQGVSRNYTGYLKLDGIDMREINLTHLRKSFGVVLQDNFLFRGTIRDNITAGRPGLTLDDVVRAARLAGAEEFIERMPAGYETFIEEGSTNISGGQKQRLAIARALISDPKLMILDEATSALDPESEALVNANLSRIGKGRTMVIVSHRLSSLVDCDQILVMERGKVADIGPHAVLVERCAIYRTLWLQQNRHLNADRNAGPAPMLAEGD